jgi:beta-lactam-binding protein with PASTA domain
VSSDEPAGRVAYTLPSGGRRQSPGSTVTIYVSAGPKAEAENEPTAKPKASKTPKPKASKTPKPKASKTPKPKVTKTQDP